MDQGHEHRRHDSVSGSRHVDYENITGFLPSSTEVVSLDGIHFFLTDVKIFQSATRERIYKGIRSIQNEGIMEFKPQQPKTLLCF